MKFLLLILVLFGCNLAVAQAATAHTATYSINNAGCSTTVACTAQIYAIVIPSGTCPAIGDASYVEIQSTLAPDSTTATNAHWDYVDSRSVLVSGQIYCAYATSTPTGGGPSPASVLFQGTIPTSTVTLPAPGISVTLK
jgi:hypothetical protein